MRIGIDITSAVRQGAGIGRFTRELVRALLALEAPHHYILFAATGGLPRAVWQPRLDYITQTAAQNLEFEICNLKLVSDDWLHRFWHRARLPVPVEVFVGRVDLFHEPDFVLPPTLRGTPTLLTVHDLTFRRDPDSALPKLRRYLERVVPQSVQRATHVLADSAASKADLVELFGATPEKITVLPGGVDGRFAPVDDAEYLANIRHKYGIGSAPFILSVGTLQPRKNYVQLIRAFARLRPLVAQEQAIEIANLKLVIAGAKGWLYDEVFAEIKQQGLEESVILPGFVDDEDLPALYSAAMVFAYPSLYEGFGLPVLEAMACGTPVVTSNVSSLPEVAGEAALAVTPTNLAALSGALLNALADETLRVRLISRGYMQASQFTWESSARQLLTVYEKYARSKN
jgi:glycosyltransferase involved in cell wall biosynthesis